MGSKELTDLTLCLHHETEKAILVSDTGDARKSKWIAKSHCEIERTEKFVTTDGKKYPVIVVTMPEWVAINKELA